MIHVLFSKVRRLTSRKVQSRPSGSSFLQEKSPFSGMPRQRAGMKRSDNLRWSQVKAGIFILVAILLFCAGVLMMGEKTKMFIQKGTLSVIMPDVAGLKIGAPVWLAGVDVGLVTDIHFETPEKNNEITVTLQIDRNALKKIGNDSRVIIKTRGLMGEKYVDITPSLKYSESPPERIY